MIMSLCLFVYLFVCLFARLSQEPHNPTSSNFLCIMPVAVAKYLSGVVRHYELPVFRITSCFYIMGSVVRHEWISLSGEIV